MPTNYCSNPFEPLLSHTSDYYRYKDIPIFGRNFHLRLHKIPLCNNIQANKRFYKKMKLIIKSERKDAMLIDNFGMQLASQVKHAIDMLTQYRHHSVVEFNTYEQLTELFCNAKQDFSHVGSPLLSLLQTLNSRLLSHFVSEINKNKGYVM